MAGWPGWASRHQGGEAFLPSLLPSASPHVHFWRPGTQQDRCHPATEAPLGLPPSCLPWICPSRPHRGQGFLGSLTAGWRWAATRDKAASLQMGAHAGGRGSRRSRTRGASHAHFLGYLPDPGRLCPALPRAGADARLAPPHSTLGWAAAARAPLLISGRFLCKARQRQPIRRAVPHV